MNGTVLEFRLKRPGFWSGRLVINAALVLLVSWWIAGGIADQVPSIAPLVVRVLVMAAAVVAIGLMLASRAMLYRAPPAPIRVRPDGLELPKSVGHPRTFVAPFRDVHTLELRGSIDRVVLLLGTKSKTYVLPGELFDRADGPAQLHAAILEQLVRQPGGTEALDKMRKGRQAMRALVDVRPRVTRALLLSIVVAYAIETMASDPSDPLDLTTLVRLGGNVPELVKAGQIDRWVTANFLHAPWSGGMGILHIGLNALALFMLGGLMERLLGGTRYFIVYILSAIGGAVASTYGAAGPVSVGASTGILGLFGALAVVHVFHLKSIPPAVRQPTRWWIIIIGINLLLGLAVPNIDQWGHGGGLVVGMVSTVLLTLKWPPLDPDAQRSTTLRAIAAGLLAVTVAGLGVSGYRAAFGGQTDLAALGAQMVEDQSADADQLNYFAWMIAIAPDATEEQLEVALRAAERAHELAPDEQGIVDTVAQVHWRLGHVDRAIELERHALGGEVDGSLRGQYATQLARWLAHRVEANGPIVVGDDAPDFTFDVRDDTLYTEMRGEPPPTGLVAYVVVERGDPLPYLLEVRLGPDATPPATLELEESWPEGMRAHVALVDSTVAVPRGVDFEVREHPPDDDIAGLP